MKTQQHATAAPSGSAALKILPSNFPSYYNLRLLCNKKKNVFSTNIGGLAPAPPHLPGSGKCPPRRRFLSVLSQRCSAPPRVRARGPTNQTPGPWRGIWERRQETPAHQNRAMWCNENGRSPWTPPSIRTKDNTGTVNGEMGRLSLLCLKQLMKSRHWALM